MAVESEVTTETLTPASEGETVPEHAHPHDHSGVYALADHAHVTETDGEVVRRLNDLESAVEELRQAPGVVANPPVEDVPAETPPVRRPWWQHRVGVKVGGERG